MNIPPPTTTELSAALGIEFSSEQLAAITAPLQPLVVMAGAGTGKTTVMAARVVWLVWTGQVRPDQVLGLTFTRKAAGELADRVEGALERCGFRDSLAQGGAATVGTYDSFAAQVVGEFGLLLGIDEASRLLAGAASFQVAARAMSEAKGPCPGLARLTPGTVVERMLALDSQLQSHLATADMVRTFDQAAKERFEAAPLYRGKVMKAVEAALAALAEREELLTLAEDYQRLKSRRGLVEFADQQRRAVRLATTLPEVGQALRNRFRVVLLDEYQDTSTAQAILLRSLFASGGFPVMAVGDPFQAIYGWRGAAADNIARFPEHFPLGDGTLSGRLSLTVNRRSGQAILDVGNAVAASLRTAATGGALAAPPSTPAGVVRVAGYETLAEELAALADEVVAEHELGTPWREMAVLARTNATLANVHRVLQDRDVPSEIVGLGGLLHLPEVAVIVATLRVLAEPTSNPATAGLLTGDRWRLGLADLQALGRRARELADGGSVSLLEAALDPGATRMSREGRRRVVAFGRELAALGRFVGGGVGELVSQVVSVLGLEAELLAGRHGDTSQLERFVAAASEYVDVDGDGDLVGFLAYLDAEDLHGDALEVATPGDEDSVKLLTVHRAKGLEWEAVWLPSLVEGTFPSVGRSGIWPTRPEALPAPLRGDAADIPQLAEYTKKGLDQYAAETKEEHGLSEDRLAYVGVTRAKRLLVGSHHVWRPGAKRPRSPSRYLEAIAKEAAPSPAAGALAPTTGENPHGLAAAVVQWPTSQDEAEVMARRSAAELVRRADELFQQGASESELDEWAWGAGTLAESEARLVEAWDVDVERAIATHAGAGERTVRLPEGLSATALMGVAADPGAFAARLLRPMPQRPSRAATTGTSFHEWLQHRFSASAPLFEELDASGPRSPEVVRLIEAFETGRFADRVPLAIEAPFLLDWSGTTLRGRIDAVFEWDHVAFDHLVVDWKTSDQAADPLQLAIYRQAWAQSTGLPPKRVGAAFYHVPSDRLEFQAAPQSLMDAALALAPRSN